MKGFVAVVLLVVLASGVVGAGSFDFYLSGDVVVGLFNNMTGITVDGLMLSFADTAELLYAVGIGADLAMVSDIGPTLLFEGAVVPGATWEAHWSWLGPRLESAAWLAGDAVVEEICVHCPTAVVLMHGMWLGETFSFDGRASADPDGGHITAYLWEWSDGVRAEGVESSRVIDEPGDYRVTLTVWDEDLQTGSRTAHFAVNACTLEVTTVGGGAVSIIPLRPFFSYGDTVTLDPEPEAGWEFAGWSGDLTGSADPASITIDGHKAVTATFTRIEYTLDVDITGSGTVVTTPDQPFYYYGDVVSLDPQAEVGWEFAGWSGDVTGSDDPAEAHVFSNTAVSASFEVVSQYAVRLVEVSLPANSQILRPASAVLGSETTPPLNTNMGTPAGGYITVEMGMYFTDGPGDDLYVFEGGLQEELDVFISEDAVAWIQVASSQKRSVYADPRLKVDIAPNSGCYRYIRIVNRSDYGGNGPGADVDAIQVLHQCFP